LNLDNNTFKEADERGAKDEPTSDLKQIKETKEATEEQEALKGPNLKKVAQKPAAVRAAFSSSSSSQFRCVRSGN